MEAWIWKVLSEITPSNDVSPGSTWESSEGPLTARIPGHQERTDYQSVEEAVQWYVKTSPGDPNVQPELRTPCGTDGESAAQRQE